MSDEDDNLAIGSLSTNPTHDTWHATCDECPWSFDDHEQTAVDALRQHYRLSHPVSHTIYLEDR